MMAYSTLSLVHIGAAVIAIVTGCLVLLRVKGTRLHRRMGLGYVVAMVILNVTSFFIFSLTGEASLFHSLAVFSLLTVIAGYTAAILRRPQGGWLEMHFQLMTWSYIGLLAAAAAEAAVRIPETRFWRTVAGATFSVLAVGAILFARQQPGLRTRYGALAGRSRS